MTNYCKLVLVLIMIINFTIDKDEKNLIESYILLFDKKNPRATRVGKTNSYHVTQHSSLGLVEQHLYEAGRVFS